MSENLTVGRATSHLSVEKNSLLISFLYQKLQRKTSNTIWARDKVNAGGRGKHTITNPNRVGRFTQ